MSEISETLQIVELIGRGGFQLGKASVKAIQFLLRLQEASEQKGIRLAYGEMSLDTLLEKQAMMGDGSVVFQVATQEPETLDEIKKELTDRGIAFSQLADFDANDGYTQFYSISSDATKLNAYFQQHEELDAGPITLDDYYNTAAPEQREEVKKDFLRGVEDSDIELGKSEAQRLKDDLEYRELLKSPTAIEISLNEELLTSRDAQCYTFRVPGTEGTLHMEIPTERVRTIDNGKTYTAVLENNKDYATTKGLKKGEELRKYLDTPRENLHYARKAISKTKKL